MWAFYNVHNKDQIGSISYNSVYSYSEVEAEVEADMEADAEAIFRFSWKWKQKWKQKSTTSTSLFLITKLLPQRLPNIQAVD